MFGYIVSMIFGIVVFCAGMMFEKSCGGEGIDEEKIKDCTVGEQGIFRQWENLLNYDGNRQEEEYEDR